MCRGVTPSHTGDSPILPDILKQIPEEEAIGIVIANGAYDTRFCYTSILECQATAIILILKNRRSRKEDGLSAMAHNDILWTTRHFGRTFWKRSTSYNLRSCIKAGMRCLRAFGERTAARDPYRQAVKVHVRIALMNRISALGTAEIVRIG